MSRGSPTQKTDETENVPAPVAIAAAHIGSWGQPDLWGGTADEITGHDLQRDKAALIGVPFLVTKIIYRDGVKRDGKPTNYVSLEIVTAPAAVFAERVKRGMLEPAGKAQPDERLVINDGGTGIARQVTQYLHAKQLIDVGPTDGDVGGPMGTSPFDRYRMTWARGGDLLDCAFDVRLRCMRGLRVSEYEAEATGQDAGTWYLA